MSAANKILEGVRLGEYTIDMIKRQVQDQTSAYFELLQRTPQNTKRRKHRYLSL